MSANIYPANYNVLNKINTIIWFSKSIIDSIENDSNKKFNKDKFDKQLYTISSYSAMGNKVSNKHFKNNTPGDIKDKINHHFNKIISCIKKIKYDMEDKSNVTNFSLSELKRIRRIAIELYFIYNKTQFKKKR